MFLLNLNRNLNVHFLAAKRVADILSRNGFEAYLIGGAVRDIWLGYIPKDFDLVTNATPEQIQSLSGLKHVQHTDAAQAFGVTRVRVSIRRRLRTHQTEVELTTFRRDIEAHLGRKATRIEYATLEDDINRRDLTINALALNLHTLQLIDLVDGIDDLRHGLIRFIGDPIDRIREDPLRVLRAIRLKNQLGFGYNASTLARLKKAISGGVIEQIAVDRTRQELSRMLIHPARAEALIDLDELGALERLLPEITAMRGVPQPESIHAEGTVWTHTLLAMRYLSDNPSRRLAWATLLHDVGKPPTKTDPVGYGDRIRFNAHAEVGADMAVRILNRFNFSKKEQAQIRWMIRYHLGIDDLPKMRPGRQATILAHPAFADLLELHKADAHAAWSKLPDGSLNRGPASFAQLEKLYRQFKGKSQRRVPNLKRDLGIDGNWLMREYGLEGSELGRALDALNEAYLDGELKSVADARQILKRIGIG